MSLGNALGIVLVIAWLLGGVAFVLVARRLKAQAAENTRLRATLGELVGELLEDAGRNRARIAEALHDDAIQTLLLAKQDLGDAGDRDGERAQRQLGRLRIYQSRGFPGGIESRTSTASISSTGGGPVVSR